ncbi:MAG: type VI secretion system contractile sheath large subunit [Planctomycetota bacterium]
MSETESQNAAQSAAAETETQTSLLEQTLAATKQTERSRAEELIETLAQEAMSGTVTWSKNLTQTFNEAIAAIDRTLSKQLGAVMHAPEFQKFEGSWRGLHHLVHNSETGTGLKVRMLNASKKQIGKDLATASEFDQTVLWKKIYEEEFGTPGGEPYGCLIGDYEFSAHPDDVEFLQNMSGIAAASFAPFVTAPSPAMLGYESWTELPSTRDIEKTFSSAEYVKWRSFRESEDSRWVSMVMPRALARLPYGQSTKPIDEFHFEEVNVDGAGAEGSIDHEQYCWMNASYVMGTVLTRAYAEHGWCTAIRGREGGGTVENLPTHTFTTDQGDTDMKCPTEIAITDRREAELSKVGFLPLCHFKNTDFSVFFGAQTTQKPKKYDTPDATANAAISARLPYLMATARFTHYLKVMARDWIGKFMEASDCQRELNNWIQNYVNANANAGPDMKAKFPLAEARVEVKEVPGAPGSYQAVAHMRPWLQMEELSVAMKLVAKIPQAS